MEELTTMANFAFHSFGFLLPHPWSALWRRRPPLATAEFSLALRNAYYYKTFSLRPLSLQRYLYTDISRIRPHLPRERIHGVNTKARAKLLRCKIEKKKMD